MQSRRVDATRVLVLRTPVWGLRKSVLGRTDYVVAIRHRRGGIGIYAEQNIQSGFDPLPQIIYGF